MKNLRLNLGGEFSEELSEEMNHLTMAGRWWLAYQLSGENAEVLAALLDDAETKYDDQACHRLAVFEDGSCVNWHEGEFRVHFDVSGLLDHYDTFNLGGHSPFEAAVLDYPVLEKYRELLTPGPADLEDTPQEP